MQSNNPEPTLRARLTPTAANALAEYLEALVLALRAHARREEAAQSERLDYLDRLSLATESARLQITRGIDRRLAATRAGIAVSVPKEHVLGQLHHQERLRKKAGAFKRT